MLLREVAIHTNRKSARFFDDHVEFGGKSIRYDDIAVLEAKSMAVYHWGGEAFALGRSFQGMVSFKQSSGKKHNIVMNAGHIFGIPFTPKNEELYSALFDAVYSIVAKSMAQKYFDMLMRGNTVEVAGISINSREAVANPKTPKKSVVINKANYKECRLADGYGISIHGKQGEALWSSAPRNQKNVLLLPYIFNSLFSV